MLEKCGLIGLASGWVMSIFSEIFSWWGGNTWGTRCTIWRQGRFVGEDELGNKYYEQRAGVGPLGVPRRWVIYRDLADASKVGADWHGWLHYTVDDPPTREDYEAKPWQKPHQMNLTGTVQAYRPEGSILTAASRPKVSGDYEAWRPEDAMKRWAVWGGKVLVAARFGGDTALPGSSVRLLGGRLRP